MSNSVSVRSLKQFLQRLTTGKRGAALRHRRAGHRQSDAAQQRTESLEARTLLTTTVFLDFGAGFFGAPIATTVAEFREIDGPGVGGIGTGSDMSFFMSDASDLTFSALNYDYNEDGAFTIEDVEELSEAVAVLARAELEPYDIDVEIARATSFDDVRALMNQNDAGMPDADGFGENDAYNFVTAVTSAEFGGGAVGNNTGLFGIAAASDLFSETGNNFDEATLTFSDTILGSAFGATPAIERNNLVHRLAYTAVHEAAHSLTFFHTTGNSSGQRLLTRGDGIRLGSDTRDSRAIFHRFDFETQSSAGVDNNWEIFANDGDMGLRDTDRNGVPDFAYVTGTGAFDHISVSPAGPGQVRVQVNAYNNNARTSQIASTNYTIDMATDTEGPIVIDGGVSNDLIEIDVAIAADVEVRGNIGADIVRLTGSSIGVVNHETRMNSDHVVTAEVTGGTFQLTSDNETSVIDDRVVAVDRVFLGTDGSQRLLATQSAGTLEIVNGFGPVVQSVSPTNDVSFFADDVVFDGDFVFPGDFLVEGMNVSVAGAMNIGGQATWNSSVQVADDSEINAAESFFAETIDAALQVDLGTVGPVDDSFGGADFREFSAGLVFEVTEPIFLESVSALTNAAGDVQVDLLDENGNWLMSKSGEVPVSNVMTPIRLGWELQPGTYMLHSDAQTTPNLRRNTSNVAFPYTNGPVSITGAIDNSNTYYWFYNWQFSETTTAAADATLQVTTGSGAVFSDDVGATRPLQGISTIGDVDIAPGVEFAAEFGTVIATGETDFSVFSSTDLSTTFASVLNFDLNGTEVTTNGVTGYDQVQIEGSLLLTGAQLNLALTFEPEDGTTFVLVDNDGADAVAGTFDGLAEGAEIDFGSELFKGVLSYVGGDGNDITVRIDAEATYIIAESQGVTEVNENGSFDDFAIFLNAQPASDVVLNIDLAATDEAEIDVTSLTFTPENWNASQSVRVTGLDDPTADGDQQSIITVSVDDENSDDAFDELPDQTVTVTTIDDEIPGFTISQTAGSTQVNEVAGTDTIDITLDARPLSDVVLDLTIDDATEATISINSLTFTPSTWNTPQTVTITGVDDLNADGDQISDLTVTLNVAESAPAFANVPPQTVDVTTIDNEVAGFTLTESDGDTTVSESGTTDTVTVVLDAEPTGNVVLQLDSPDVSEALVSPLRLTLTPANWNVPQTITFTGQDDPIIDGNQTTAFTISIDQDETEDAFDGVADQMVSVITIDDDAAELLVLETDSSSIVDETSTTDTISVALTAQPASDVVIFVASADTGEVVVSTNSLTFTPADWDSPQVITLVGVDDAQVDGTISVPVTLTVDDANSDDDFDGLVSTITAINLDDEVAGFTVTVDSPLELQESGAGETFQVVLNEEPLADVVIDLTISDATEVALDVDSLTFTSADWDAPQTVTASGVDDVFVDGLITSRVTLSINDAASHPLFADVADQTVAAETQDNDSASVGIQNFRVEVAESGTSEAFFLFLGAGPLSDVVLSLSARAPDEVSLSTDLVTFTSANWNVPQEVTVTGVDDVLVDGDQLTFIDIVVIPEQSNDAFDGIAGVVEATTLDDDIADYSVDLANTNFIVGEDGTNDSFDVVLTAAPVTPVVFAVSSSDNSEGTVSDPFLTFDSSNWDTPQTVTVNGVDDTPVDGDIDFDITVEVVADESDNAFDALAGIAITFVNLDDEVAGFTVTPSASPLVVSETGTSDTFDIVLNDEPLTPVVLTIASSDLNEVATNLTSVTFDSGNWDTPQTVTATGLDDLIVDGDIAQTITVAIDPAASDDFFDSLPDQVVDTLTLDDDVAAFSALASDGSTEVSETGTTDTIAVVLDRGPLSDVIVNVTVTDTTEASADQMTLTFTPMNWNTPQDVTITGVDDPLVDDTQTFDVVFSIDNSSNPDFVGLAPDVESVSVMDDDIAGVTVQATIADVSEDGGTATAEVVLDSAPLTPVVVNVESDDTGEVTILPGSLTFDSSNWDTPQSVTLTGEDDVLADGDIPVNVRFWLDGVLSDPAFATLPPQARTVTNIDNDTAGFVITQTGAGAEVAETGSTDTFTLMLTAAPVTQAVFEVQTAGDEVTADPQFLTFTSANWAVEQTVTLTGVDDLFVDGPQTTVATVSVVAADSHANYQNVADDSFDVITNDNDIAGFTIDNTALVVSETGTTAEFTIALDAGPLSDVVLDFVVSDSSEAELSVSSHTATMGNWETPQVVTVTGLDDVLVDGDIMSLISVSVNPVSDPAFVDVADQEVAVETLDDDIATLNVSESALRVSEDGTTATFDVVLGAAPVTPVTVSVAADDSSESETDLSSLTFDDTNWNVPQTVTVTGLNDDTVDGDVISSIGININGDSDPAFSGLNNSVRITTDDNDVAGFSVTETGGDTTVSEDGQIDSFDVVLLAGPLTDVVIQTASLDSTIADTSTDFLTFTPLNWNVPQTVTVSGSDDPAVDGTQQILVASRIVDDESDDAFDSLNNQNIVVSVLDDDEPGIEVIETGNSTSVSESGTSDVVDVVLTAAPTDNVVFDVTSVGEEYTFSPSALTFTSSNWAIPQRILLMPVDDLRDDGNVVQDLNIAVNPALSVDTFDALPGVTVPVLSTDDDTAGVTITANGSLTVDEPGGVATADVVLDAQPVGDVQIVVTSADPARLGVSGNLTFNAANWDQPQTISMTGINNEFVDGDALVGVNVSVTAASDAVFDTLFDQNLTISVTDDDLAGLEVTETDGSTVVAEDGQTDEIQVVLLAAPLTNVSVRVLSSVPDNVAIDTDLLSFTPANWNVPQTVTLSTQDDDFVEQTLSSVIQFTIAPGSNSEFVSLPTQLVQATSESDDVAGIVLTETDGSTEMQEGGSDVTTVRLSGAPLGNVVLEVESGDLSEATIFPRFLTFTSANWGVDQNITINAPTDELVDGNQSSTITVRVDNTRSDNAFDGLSSEFEAATEDTDTAGFTVTETNGSTVVGEDGTQDQFSVVLDAEPLSAVVINVASTDTAEISVGSDSLTFTPANWDTPQNVIVSGVDEDVDDGDQTRDITVQIDMSASDAAYAGVVGQTVSATNVDNDEPIVLPNLDVDDNGELGSLTDGILVIRFLAGFTGNSLTNDAIGDGANRSSATAISDYLDLHVTTMLDVDGDGNSTPLTDGILIIRAMAGFSGDVLVEGAIASGATRTTPEEILDYLSQFGIAGESGGSGAAAAATMATPIEEETPVLFGHTAGNSSLDDLFADPGSIWN